MGPYPEVAVFRRFGSLNMLNLMSCQAELIQLEDQYRVICEVDDTSSSETLNMLSSDFHLLRESKAPNDTQKAMLSQIRSKLFEYSTKTPSKHTDDELPRLFEGG